MLNKKILFTLFLISLLALNVEAKKGKNSKEKNSKEKGENSKENWTKENSREMKNRERDLVCNYEKDMGVEGRMIRRLNKKKLADCCDACSAAKNCYFFEYDKKEKTCFLYRQNGRLVKKKKCKIP